MRSILVCVGDGNLQYQCRIWIGEVLEISNSQAPQQIIIIFFCQMIGSGNQNDAIEESEDLSSLVLKPSKRSSKIEYEDLFSEFSEQSVLSQSFDALYLGNLSDLWGFYRSIIKTLSNQFVPADYSILNNLSFSCQLYLLESAAKLIQQNQIKNQINKTIAEKTKARIQYKSQQFLYMLQNDFQSTEFRSRALLSSQISQDNLIEDVKEAYACKPSKKGLRMYKILLQMTKNKSKYQKKIPDASKGEKILKLLCLYLRLTLSNLSWKKLTLTSIKLTDFKVYLIATPNGAKKLIQFFHDAPESQLLKEYEQIIKLLQVP